MKEYFNLSDQHGFIRHKAALHLGFIYIDKTLYKVPDKWTNRNVIIDLKDCDYDAASILEHSCKKILEGKNKPENITALVIDHGDTSVGIYAEYYDVKCPFQLRDMDKDALEWFRGELLKLYGEYAQGKLTVHYDFEKID